MDLEQTYFRVQNGTGIGIEVGEGGNPSCQHGHGVTPGRKALDQLKDGRRQLGMLPNVVIPLLELGLDRKLPVQE